MLTIQKLVVLLDEFHYTEFVTHLEKSKALLPAKLVLSIREKGMEQPESEDLCSIIYNKNDEKTKKNFFQLAHHTLKLSIFLARNYTNYLSHNLSKIERLINSGRKEEANQWAEILLDVAEKIEDRPTQIAVLKFFAQQAFHAEQKNHVVKFHIRINEVLQGEQSLNEIYLYMRENLNFKNKSNFNENVLEKHIAFFDKYVKHKDFSVNFLARYAKTFAKAFYHDEQFFHQDNYREIVALEKELEKNSFVVFPFLDDVLFRLYSIKIQYLFYALTLDELLDETMSIIKNADYILFWKNFINAPEIFAISIQTSHYVSEHLDTYRDDFETRLPADVKEKVMYLRKRCEEMLSKSYWKEGYYVKYINLRSLYCALLLLGSRADVRKSVELTEEMLVSYQQISFQKFLDGIFASLLLGYFTLKEYEKVSDTYKRYRKLTADNVTNLENDATLTGFYYASQWIASGKKQYHDKFYANIERLNNPNLERTKKALLDLADYYEIKR